MTDKIFEKMVLDMAQKIIELYEKQLVNIHFEEGYYINIKKNDKDTYKETILLNFIQSKEADK